MILKKLQISNFKMFDDLSLDFEAGFNLILGDNGVGKTTILEAASVAISGFLAGMEDVSTRNIYKDDVRYRIVKDSNGTPNKSYSNKPTEIESTLLYGGENYTWVRAKKDATGASRTSINPKDILKISRELVNSTENRVLPLISYQSASRHWVTARSDANEKKRKQLHDRRCGYLGCLNRTANLQMIYDWCKQMEWNSVKTKRIPQNYEMFGRIISKFMNIMNDGTASEVLFHPIVEKLLYVENDEYKEIEDLSAGYQSILNLVIDLAYRMSILNPDAGERIAEVEGIVLIDEIDSNLHPKWQWRIVDALTKTFPNVQFIAATHSPIIVSSCKNAHIISIDSDQKLYYISDSYAFSVNEILKDMLGYYMRPAKVENLIEEFEKRMDRDQYREAKEILTELIGILGEEHPEVIALKSEYESEAEE
ncbi:MAG: AAA family ATPase [Lachnoclostridium sp.]|nr:AAA family ATPase [Lachnoclostridium sp.]